MKDFRPLGNYYFNLSMTYRLNADIPHRYGRLVQVAPHPDDLETIVREFGAANSHLARKEKAKSEEEVLAAQFVSKCVAPSERKATLMSNSRS